MGIKDLISKVIPDNLKVYNTFESLKNRTMGDDVSNYLFKLITTRDSLVRDYHCEPRLNVSSQIYKFCDLFKILCDKYCITLVLVLDEKRNPMSRESLRADNILKLDDLLINGDEDDLDDVLRIQKSTMHISEDMLLACKVWALKNDVRCIQSLYEADAGLQHLEDVGLTDGTFSEDDDFFALGRKLWATKVSFIKRTVMIFNSTIIREALYEKILKGRNMEMSADHGRVLYVLLGCDYLDRPKGFGPKTVETFVSQWILSTAAERNTMLLRIESGNKKRKINEISAVVADSFPDYSKRFWLAFNMSKHPPIFYFKSFTESDVISLGLLGKDNEEISPGDIFGLLGFHAFEIMSDIGDLRRLLHLENSIFIRTMRPLLPIN